jgi:hypothetical protein
MEFVQAGVCASDAAHIRIPIDGCHVGQRAIIGLHINHLVKLELLGDVSEPIATK